MATAASTLVARSRRFVGDWSTNDILTASCTSTATSITVADGTIYSVGWLLQLDQEALYITANGTGTTVPVLRGQRGTTGASHASGAAVMIRPNFLDIEYLDALNSGINATYPWLYHAINDTSITTSPTVYEYAVPNDQSGFPIRYLYRISFLENSDLSYREMRDWEVVRAGVPMIKFRRYLPAGTLRIQGFSPIAPLASLTDTLDPLFPVNAEDLLTLYAAQFLLESGETRRARESTGARDDREAANRPGTASAAAQTLLQRFQMRLMSSAMQPLPPHIKAVF